VPDPADSPKIWRGQATPPYKVFATDSPVWRSNRWTWGSNGTESNQPFTMNTLSCDDCWILLAVLVGLGGGMYAD